MFRVFYAEQRASLRPMARRSITIGSPCAALYEGVWYRGRITEVNDDDTVEVRMFANVPIPSLSLSSLYPCISVPVSFTHSLYISLYVSLSHYVQHVLHMTAV